MTSDDTADLVRQAQAGDTLAMNELLDRLSGFVGRICAPIALGNGADATQEALIAVFRRLRSLHEPDAVWGWVRTIAVREAVRVAKRQGSLEPVASTELPGPEDPQLAADIKDTLRRLSPTDRAILVLRDVEGLDERAAAELLDVSSSAARSRLHRARDSFRKEWRS